MLLCLQYAQSFVSLFNVFTFACAASAFVYGLHNKQKHPQQTSFIIAVHSLVTVATM